MPRPLPGPARFRYWVDYQALSSPESAALAERALQLLGGIRTGARRPPRAPPGPPLGRRLPPLRAATGAPAPASHRRRAPLLARLTYPAGPPRPRSNPHLLTGGPPKLDPLSAQKQKIRDYGYMHMGAWDLLLSITAKAMLAAEVLRPGQLVSIVPGCLAISRKTSLVSRRRRHQDAARGGRGAAVRESAAAPRPPAPQWGSPSAAPLPRRASC